VPLARRQLLSLPGRLDLDEFRELKNPLVSERAELESRIAAVPKRNPNRLEPL
jgi:hypothetical protein